MEDLYGVAARFNADTWTPVVAGCRIAYVYDLATKTLQYFVGSGGTYSRKANISVPQTAIDTQVVGSNFSISKPFDGPGGATFDGSHWQGSLNNCLISKQAWTTEQLVELFALADEDFPSLSFYSDIYSWIRMGEDTFPAAALVRETSKKLLLRNETPGSIRRHWEHSQSI